MKSGISVGATVRSLRREKNLTGEELAKLSGLSQSKISKIETGFIARPRHTDIERLLNILDAPQTIRQRFSEAANRDSVRLLPFDYQYPFGDLSRQETAATNVRVFCITLMPTLLQTYEYRQAMHRYSHLPEKLIQLSMQSTLARQDRMWDKHRRYHFIIVESALYTRIGNDALHIAQLDRIERFITAGNHIKVGIVPYQAGFIPKDLSGFTIYDNTSLFKGVGSGDTYSTDEGVIQLHLQMFDALERLTDYGDAARTIVRRAMDYFS